MKKELPYYYENILARENYVAKPNSVWVADFTEIEIEDNKKIYAFICVDIFANRVVTSQFSTKGIPAVDVVKKLETAIDLRLPIKPIRELIIHTDRGGQFIGNAYHNFVIEYEGFMVPSMSEANTPKDNSVAERYMRTFKEHKINNRTFEQELAHQRSLNSKFRGYKGIFNLYIRSLNSKPNKKSKKKSPERHDLDSSVASQLMSEPKYSKAFSKHFGPDHRRSEIDRFKLESMNVSSILEEIAAKKAELVDKTPFDNYEDNLAIQVINERLQDIYALIRSHPELTREHVQEAIAPIQVMLEEMDNQLNVMLPKRRKDRQSLPLRDPVRTELFEIFFNAAGVNAKYKKDLKMAQLKVAYTILFYVGLRVNEIRLFQEEDIRNAIKTSQFSVIHFKQKTSHIHVISDLAVKELKKLEYCYEIIFIKYKQKYLFGKDKPIAKQSLIRTINTDLQHICKINNIPYNIKSHSFRINMISRLLKNTSVQNAADIIGHSDIKSTMAYKRYALDKKEIQDLLNKIEEQD